MLPARYALFAFILSGLMSFVVSGVATLRVVGLAERALGSWSLSWPTGWIVA